MYVNLKWVKKNFAIMNKRFFNGSLPTPVFVVNYSAGYLGQCSYRGRGQKYGKHETNQNYTIRISNRRSRNEGNYLNTLLHEMIHLYFYSIGKTKVGHGPEFQKMGRSFDKYGFEIRTRSAVRSDLHPSLSCGNTPMDLALDWTCRLLLIFVAWMFVSNADALKVLGYLLKVMLLAAY